MLHKYIITLMLWIVCILQSNRRVKFVINRKLGGGGIWVFVLKKYADKGFFITDTAYYKTPNNRIFIGFENMETGQIVGNYFKYGNRLPIMLYRVLKNMLFFIRKIKTHTALVSTCYVYPDTVPKVQGTWGVCRIPKADFDMENFSITCLDNAIYLQNKDILYADVFFDSRNENTLLIEYWDNHMSLPIISYVAIQNNTLQIEKHDILKSGYHSSYPYGFVYQGKHYAFANIYPEGKRVTVYENLGNGVFEPTAHSIKVPNQKNIQDFTPFEYKGVWYAFASSIDCDVLHLYTAHSPFDIWELHPQSPLSRGYDGNRPAGYVIYYNNTLYRVAQNCTLLYGHSISLFKITDLSQHTYGESYVKHLELPLRAGFACVHTVNIGAEYVVFDYIKQQGA